MKKTIFAALAFSLLAPAAALEAQSGLGRDQEEWTWSGPLSAGQWARGHSINGAIKFEPSPDNQVHIRAEKKWGRRGDPRDISFALVRTSTGLTVCVLRHEIDSCEEDGIDSRRQRDYNNDAYADITIQVPRGAHVSANTVNGAVRVDGVSGQIKASTVNGSINTEFPLTITGRLGPKHARGTINGGGERISISTVNGSVRLRRS